MRETCSICGGRSFRPTPFVNVMGLGANLVECDGCKVRCYDRQVCTPEAAYDNPASHQLAEDCLTFGAMNNRDKSRRAEFVAAHWSMYHAILGKAAALCPTMARVYEQGCNIGEFLEVAQHRGLGVAGCEPNRRAMEIATAAGLPVEHAFFQGATVPPGQDAVVMLDVIEHTDTPMEDLHKAFAHTAPGGLVIIKTFFDEYHDKIEVDPGAIQGSHAWAMGLEDKGYFDPIQHVFHFPEQLLHDVVKMAGYQVERADRCHTYGQLTIYGVKP